MAFSVLRRPCVAVLLPGPGDAQRPSKPSRLIIPGTSSFKPTPQSPVTEPIAEPVPSETKRTFRPPMGYFTKRESSEVVTDVDAEMMIQRLNSGAGRWYDLAAYLPQLSQVGYDSNLLEELTGIPKPEQSILVTGASVLESIRLHLQQEELPDDPLLQFFDIQGTHFALYELRFLDVDQRVMCAKYIAQEQLHAQDARDLARATREHKRRGGELTGFETTPEDILAYKFYRNALESREQDLIASYVEKGLKVAFSDAAKAKLEEVFTGHEKLQSDLSGTTAAKIHIYRLLSEEVLMRVVPFAGNLTEVEGKVLRSCPTAKTEGPFSVFSLRMEGEQDWKWVSLPNWALFAHALKPVALSIKNCADMPELRSSVQAKSKEEALRLSGPGLLIADSSVTTMTDPNTFYLVPNEAGVKLSDGNALESEGEVLGKVLFVCRPPDKDSEF